MAISSSTVTSVILGQCPTFEVTDAERIAREWYGVVGRAVPLTSERDQNFLIDDPARGGMVLKIANASEQRGLLEAEQQVLTRLSEREVPAPRVLAQLSGETLTEVEGSNCRRHF